MAPKRKSPAQQPEMSGPFDETTKIHWLRLLRSENVGPITFFHLLNRFKSAQEAVKRLPEIASRNHASSSIRIPSLQEVQAEYTAYQKMGIHLIAKPETNYPERLRHIPDAPPLISVFGDLSLLKRPFFAIVGSRNASAIGKNLAETFASELGQAGFVIVSGLARGIDTCVHKKSLPFGTAAVMAGGVDHIYPPENASLYQTIANQGIVLSEAPLGHPPHANLFPRRNRIISGLSCGVLVIEAAVKSGSLITARYAAEQGRDVFAIPGSPLDPRSRGTNTLIQDGAYLIQSPQEIIDHYAQESPAFGKDTPLSERAPDISAKDLSSTQEKILQSLTYAPLLLDTLIRQLCIPPAILHAALVEIEIAGYLDRHPGGRVSLKPPI